MNLLTLIIVTWIGDTLDLQLTIRYILKKDEHFYTTDLTFENLSTTATLTDLYYYRNVDPDNNQTLSGSYTTTQTLISQPYGTDTVTFVRATQDSPWYSELIFESEPYNTDWRAIYGGFTNRDASDIWNSIGVFEGVPGSTNTSDEAISLAYKIGALPPGKSVAHNTHFKIRFKPADPPVVIDDLGLNDEESAFNLFPTVTYDLFTIEFEGEFGYFLINSNGQILKEGQGFDKEVIDISDLPAGNYFVKLKSDQIFLNKTVIKQ